MLESNDLVAELSEQLKLTKLKFKLRYLTHFLLQMKSSGMKKIKIEIFQLLYAYLKIIMVRRYILGCKEIGRAHV